MKKFKASIIAGLCLMLALSTSLIVGCGSRDYNKINLNEVTHSIFYAPFYAAINLGYFEDEGLEINLTNGGGSDVSMSALVSGSADIILAGPETVVYTSQEGISDQPKFLASLRKPTAPSSFQSLTTPTLSTLTILWAKPSSAAEQVDFQQ